MILDADRLADALSDDFPCGECQGKGYVMVRDSGRGDSGYAPNGRMLRKRVRCEACQGSGQL